ncbi:MAG: metallophosphoesterase [Clostridia bacterium]|nr:metallophosphoesterase [Clostridia bacterium]
MKNNENNGRGLKIVTASDIHYLAPALMENRALFSRHVIEKDAKTVEYGDALTDAFISETARMRPDAVILSGDLSFNGEKESHLRLASKLSSLTREGIAVLVTTGNHDTENKKAASFSGADVSPAETVTTAGFAEIYGAFGPGIAKGRDRASLSYTYILRDTLIVMLDANSPACPCGISGDTLSWLEGELKSARREGMRVICVGHQNLFRHSIFDRGYVMENAARLRALLSAYGVRLFLSGHMHIQHIMSEGGITEIATSALPVGACRYGLLTVTGDSASYAARSADVSAWAHERGEGDINLLSFSDYARRRMDEKTASQTAKELSGKPFTDGEKETMTRFAQEANFAYFSGGMKDLAERDPQGLAGALWERSGTFTGRYLTSVIKEAGHDHTRATVRI